MATWTGSWACSQSDTNAEKAAKIQVYYTAGSGSITIHKIRGNRTDGYYTGYESSSNSITITVGGTSKTLTCNKIWFGAAEWVEWTDFTDQTFSVEGSQTVKVAIASWLGTSYISNGAYWSGTIDAGNSTATLTFNANGGSDAPSAQTVTVGSSVTIPDTEPTREGHIFLGWAKTSGATSATYSAGDTITVSSDTTLFAVWESEETATPREPVSTIYANDGTAYEGGRPWINVGGTWTRGLVWINDGGTWKLGYGNADAEEAEVKLVKIAVTQNPDTNYVIIEEPIDLTGMEITATYSDGSTKVVTGWTYSPTVLNQAISPCIVTITYTENGVTATTTHSMYTFT